MTAEEKKPQEEAAAKEAKEEKPQAQAVKEEKTEEKAQKKEEKTVELTGNMKSIVETLEKMTVLELSGLVKALEDKFGVSAQAPMAVAGMAVAGGAGQAGGGAAEEKSSFNVVLADVGSNKIQVIKEIRAITTLGLKEAKELVESAPKAVKEGATKEEADKIKAQLEKAGAKVELK